MLTTPHLLVGAAIGAQFNNPYIVVPAAVGSHFILDSVPHLMGVFNVHDLDKKDIVFVASDVLLGVSLVYLMSLFSPNPELLFLGAFAAMVPDFHHTFQLLFGSQKLEKYTNLHLKFHYKKRMSLIPGLATQITTVLAATMLIWFRI